MLDCGLNISTGAVGFGFDIAPGFVLGGVPGLAAGGDAVDSPVSAALTNT